MKNINIGDIYWMPARTYLDKKLTSTKLVITKVGKKFIYANKEGTKSEYKLTFESDGVLNLVNSMCSGKAYSEEIWKKQKLIIELDDLTKEFKQGFLQINDSTDFSKYQNLVNEMNELSQRILKFYV